MLDIHDMRRGLDPLAVSVDTWLVALSPLALPMRDGRFAAMFLGCDGDGVADAAALPAAGCTAPLLEMAETVLVVAVLSGVDGCCSD